MAACARLLPARIASEELGDLLEDVERRLDAGQGRVVYLRVIGGCGWALVNAMRYQPSTGGTMMNRELVTVLFVLFAGGVLTLVWFRGFPTSVPAHVGAIAGVSSVWLYRLYRYLQKRRRSSS